MEKVTMLEFRRNAEGVIRRSLQGRRMILTYRGKPVMRLEPVGGQEATTGDPFYGLGRLAVEGQTLTNEQIDATLYGE